MPAAISLTTQAFSPDQRSRAIATLTTAQIVGNVGGGWLGGWMAQHRSWREAFFVLGLIGVLYTAPYFSFLRGVREERPTEVSKIRSGSAIAELVRSPMFLLLCVVFPIFVFGLWLLYSWFPDFLYEKFSLDLAQAGRDATVYLQSATFIGILGGGVFADRLTRRTPAARCWLLVASFVLCAPCLYAIGQAHAVGNARLAAAAFGLFSGLLMGNIFPAAFEVVGGDARASAVGALNFCGAILSGCAALFGGMWKKSVGFERLLTATGIAYLCAAVLVVAGIRLFFARDRERIRASTG
jgi:predicted MFS family arabinose efflux permease